MVALLALAACAALPARAHGQAVSANDFEIDAYEGPVLGASRIVGLGGAYTAIATGIDSAAWNPAAYGARELYEQDWFQWELTASLLLPGAFSKNDYFNNGLGKGIGVDNFVFLDLGARLQFGPVGVGGVFDWQTYVATNGADPVDVTLLTGHLGAAYGLFGGQLLLGLGLRTASLDLTLHGGPTLVSFLGAGLEVGGLWAPAPKPWRIGMALRTPVSSGPDRTDAAMNVGGVEQVDGFVLPRKVHLPWELQLGFAWQFGDRPINQRWLRPPDPKDHLRFELRQRRCWRELVELRKEQAAAGKTGDLPPGAHCPDLAVHPRDAAWWRHEMARRKAEDEKLERLADREEEQIDALRKAEYAALSRYYWLLTTGLVLIGTTDDGIGLDAFIDQQRRRAGQHVTVGLRAGVETEPWQGHLKVRLGFYLEPGRNHGVHYRPHATGGFDFKLFSWNLFGLVDTFSVKLGFTADVAPRYYDLGFGLGFWH